MKTGQYQEALSVANRMLAIDSQSVCALELKAECLWENPEINAENKLEAKLICEQVFRKGSRNLPILNILLEYHFIHQNDLEFLHYATEYVRLRPLPEIFLMMGSAYHRQGDNEKALESFQMVRLHDKYYEQEKVSLGIVLCLFRLAVTRKDYERCARKLSNYLALFGQGEQPPVVETMLNQLREMHIVVHDHSTQNENSKENENESKQDDPYSEWVVPQEIKNIINDAMNKMSFFLAKPMKQSGDLIAESGIDPNSVFTINNSISAFIDPKAKTKLTAEQHACFTEELKKGNVKKLAGGKGKWEITTHQVHSKFRLVTNGFFSRPKPGNPNQQELVLRFGGKVKTHAAVRAAIRK